MKRENAAKRYYKKNMIILMAVFIPLDIFSLLVMLPFVDSPANILYVLYVPIVMFGVSIPFIIYNVARFIQYSNIKFINIHHGKVVDSDSLSYGRYGTYIGFYVVFYDDFGEKKTVMTKHVHTKADGYFNATVTVGQNPSNGEWIILE